MCTSILSIYTVVCISSAKGSADSPGISRTEKTHATARPMDVTITADIVNAEPFENELTTAAAIALRPICMKPIKADAIPIFSLLKKTHVFFLS